MFACYLYVAQAGLGSRMSRGYCAEITKAINEGPADAETKPMLVDAIQESIKASKEWFMACGPHAAGMAAQMADFLCNAPTHDQRLHVLYLANDILLKGYTICLCAAPSAHKRRLLQGPSTASLRVAFTC